MLVNFESKSARVKGVSFHPKRPWVLASLHNGTIQLWDYRMQTLIDKFEEHDGPVRGVAFHATQPLFVSGGDDYKIKVWNYKQRKCLFTLNGHLDYVRTVFFHHEYPWIISASDDQTIRIWNWQSRNCLTILTGHTHYVMCAQFHPKEDLVVSASLDQSVRVWDISGLRKKNTNAPANRFPDEISRASNMSSASQADMFGNTDVLVKYVLEGHDRGVNWASFHPNLPLIVSGADDRQVKLWRMSDTKAWEVDTMRGHYNNVSCVLFHPRQELIISNSEDKTIRVWDMSKRSGVQTFRRETDRFWVLVAHPERNVFAAGILMLSVIIQGHDNGLLVFKFERERPAYFVTPNSLFYIKDKTLKNFDFQTGNDVNVIGIKKAPGLNTQPRSLSYNVAENAIIVTSPVDGGIFEIYQLPKEYLNSLGEPPESTDVKRGGGTDAIFVARNRYAVLNRSTQNLNNDSTKSIQLTGNVSDIFFAGTGQLIMSAASSVILYDIQTQQQIAELSVPPAKYVYWSVDQSLVALVSRFDVVIANSKFEQQCRIREPSRIKSGIWDESGVFLYSTLSHIKYALPQGDNGIIRTLENPLYLVKSSGKTIFCLDRDGKCRSLAVDPTEFRFKLSLSRKRYDEVMHIIQNSNLVGQAIIAYLTKKGYPEVALQFVKDQRTRFDLALECGNLEIASEMAKAIDTPDCWLSLASAANRQGNLSLVELSLQRVKDFEKLSFTYQITSATDKLLKLEKIAQIRKDTMAQFTFALLSGDMEAQIGILRESGLAPLAFATASTYGIASIASEILTQSSIQNSPVLPKGGSLLRPLRPLNRSSANDWPTLPLSRGFFDAQAIQPSVGRAKESHEKPKVQQVDAVTHADPLAISVDTEASWGIDDDLDIRITQPESSETTVAADKIPTNGASFEEIWIRNSFSVVDHVAAGSFDSAMQLLNRQFGVVNFEPLKPFFVTLFISSRSSLSLFSSSVPSQIVPLNRNWPAPQFQALPLLSISYEQCNQILQQAYSATTAGQFAPAIGLFKKLLHQTLFLSCKTSDELKQAESYVSICREYVLGLTMELNRRELPDSPEGMKRNVELAAYFTHCELQPVHLILSLQLAMTQAYKLKCFQTASQFIKRLLELGPPAPIAEKARKLQSVIENSLKDDVKLDYSPLDRFAICASSYSPVYVLETTKKCPMCQATYKDTFAKTLCKICSVSEIGKPASGMTLNK